MAPDRETLPDTYAVSKKEWSLAEADMQVGSSQPVTPSRFMILNSEGIGHTKDV